MKFRKCKILLTMAALTPATLTWAPQAQAVETRIATVDMEAALRTVEEGKQARSKLESEFNQKRKELEKENAEIKKMHEEFQKQSLVMSAEAKAKKEAEIQKRILQFQEKTVRTQQEFQGKEANLVRPIIDGLKEIITKLAEEKKYTLVLEKNENAVLYSVAKDDLTKEVISKYNEKKK